MDASDKAPVEPAATEAVEAKGEEAPAEARTSFADLHTAMMTKGEKEAIAKPDTPVKDAPVPSVTDKPSEAAPQNTAEGKEPVKEKAAVPSKEGTTDEQETETPATPIPKHEREKYRLRKQRDAAEERAKVAEARLKELGVGDEAPEPDPAVQAELKAKAAISRKHFVKTYGEEKLKEMFAPEAPWMEIEERAKTGEREATLLMQRAWESDDPFEEIQTIVEDERVYEEYGTRSVAAIVAAALETQKHDLEKRFQAEQINRQPITGKPAPTLSKVSGKTPEAQKTEVANTPFSLRELYRVS